MTKNTLDSNYEYLYQFLLFLLSNLTTINANKAPTKKLDAMINITFIIILTIIQLYLERPPEINPDIAPPI